MKWERDVWLTYIAILVVFVTINIILIITNQIFLGRNLLYSYDLPHYISIAQTLYLNPSVYNSFEYGYFTHLILFPLLIRLVSPFNLILGVYIISMTSWAVTGFFFLKICELDEIDPRYRFILMILFFGGFNGFAMFASTNGALSIMILLVTASYYFYRKEKHYIAGLVIGLAAITHVVGIVFPVAFFLIMMAKKRWTQALWYIQGGVFLILQFGFFYLLGQSFFVTLIQQAQALNDMFIGGYFLGLILNGVLFLDRVLTWGFTIGFFLLIFISIYYRKNLDLLIIALLNFLVVFNWYNVLNALRILTFGASLLILNLKIFQTAFEPESAEAESDQRSSRSLKIDKKYEKPFFACFLITSVFIFTCNLIFYTGIMVGMQVLGAS